MKASIMTVLGPISSDNLGYTYMHEHVIVDCSFSGNNPLKKLEEEDVLTWEMKDVLRAGGKTIVDCTSIGLGPNPEALKRISANSGINIITCTGFYRSVVYPEYVFTSSVDDLVRRMADDCLHGLQGTDVRPGMLAEFASAEQGGPPAEYCEKVFRAASRVHLKTGLPITTHCTIDKADWHIKVFREEGVPLDKVVLAHIVPEDEKALEHTEKILNTGVNIGIDAIGYGERDDFTIFEHGKAQLVKTFIEWGYIDQITISLDMTRKYHLKKYGGHGFAFLMDCFVPLLREVGLSDQQVDHILIENPRRILTHSIRQVSAGSA